MILFLIYTYGKRIREFKEHFFLSFSEFNRTATDMEFLATGGVQD